MMSMNYPSIHWGGGHCRVPCIELVVNGHGLVSMGRTKETTVMWLAIHDMDRNLATQVDRARVHEWDQYGRAAPSMWT